jgi:hypothetical protein
LEQQEQSFIYIHVYPAWDTLAKMKIRKRPDAGRSGDDEEVVLQRLLQRLRGLTLETVPEMGARDVANVVHRLAKLHESGRMAVDGELVGLLQARARERAGAFKPRWVANLVWGLAKMDVKPDAVVLEAMQGQATAMADDFEPLDILMLMWALAKMGVKSDAGLVEAMQGRATATADDFNPPNIALFLWALATMGITPDADLLEAIQGQATATAGDFNPQDVAMLLWAHACLGAPHTPHSGRMAESMAVQLLSLQEQLRGEELCKTQLHQWLVFCDLDPGWREKLPKSMQKVYPTDPIP